MDQEPAELQRRAVLQMAVGLAAASAPAIATANPLATLPAPTGKPGDSDFLAGEWKIRHEHLKNDAWDRCEGEVTVHSILGGVGRVEELRIPARQFSGIGLRLLDTTEERPGRRVGSCTGHASKAPTNLAASVSFGVTVDARSAWSSYG